MPSSPSFLSPSYPSIPSTLLSFGYPSTLVYIVIIFHYLLCTAEKDNKDKMPGQDKLSVVEYFRVYDKHEDRQLSTPEPANPAPSFHNKRTLSLKLVDSSSGDVSPAPPPSSCGHPLLPAVGSIRWCSP